MSAFDQGRQIEKKGAAMIAPLLRRWTGNGRLFDNSNAPPEQQRRDGDFLIIKEGRRIKIEFKTEVENKNKNFFFEIMSNTKVGFERKGWLITCQADGLLYLFQDTGELYSILWPKCKQWLYENDWRYNRAGQSKYKQKNKTVGLLVPIKDLVDLGLARLEPIE